MVPLDCFAVVMNIFLFIPNTVIPNWEGWCKGNKQCTKQSIKYICASWLWFFVFVQTNTDTTNLCRLGQKQLWAQFISGVMDGRNVWKCDLGFKFIFFKSENIKSSTDLILKLNAVSRLMRLLSHSSEERSQEKFRC